MLYYDKNIIVSMFSVKHVSLLALSIYLLLSPIFLFASQEVNSAEVEVDSSEILNLDYSQYFSSLFINLSDVSDNFESASDKQYIIDVMNGYIDRKCAAGLSGRGDDFYTAGEKYNNHPYVLLAIATADTQCGQRVATAYNIGNVGNNDRGDRVAFDNYLQGIEAISKTLSNSSMGGNKYIWQLSNGGRTALGHDVNCSQAPSPYKCYATSEYNWHKNVSAEFNVLLGYSKSGNVSFKLSDYIS